MNRAFPGATVFILACVFSAFADTAAGAAAKRADLTVRLEKIRPGQGRLLCLLFDRAECFPESVFCAVASTSTEAAAGAFAVFYDLPYGVYALSVLHDKNGNLRMDRNIFGAPEEGFGFSNNPGTFFGPPSFNRASFVIDGNSPELKIRLKY